MWETKPKDIVNYKKVLEDLHQRLVLDYADGEGEKFEQYDEDRWAIYSVLQMIDYLEKEKDGE